MVIWGGEGKREAGTLCVSVFGPFFLLLGETGQLEESGVGYFPVPW